VRQDDYNKQLDAAKDAVTTRLTELTARIKDEDMKKGLQRLLKSTQPIKGREEMNRAWNIPVIRIAYGTTKDPSKPATVQPGEMFSTNGKKIAPKFMFTPLYLYESNRMFQEGQNAPTCWSPDAKLGKMFGPCNKCMHQPLGKNQSGERTDCNNGISVIALGKDMQVYRIEFFKTSRRAGSNLDRLSQAGTALWERWFLLDVQSVKNQAHEYSVFKTGVQGEDVPEDVQDVCDTLYDFFKAERTAFLERFYEMVASGGEDNLNDGAVGEGVDEKAMMGGDDKGDTNPDLSSGSM
jgi:hypothetical protein